ncbi:hypothetical protein KPATCC21470_0170 [Kitasatospora purpeofusca]
MLVIGLTAARPAGLLGVDACRPAAGPSGRAGGDVPAHLDRPLRARSAA